MLRTSRNLTPHWLFWLDITGWGVMECPFHLEDPSTSYIRTETLITRAVMTTAQDNHGSVSEFMVKISSRPTTAQAESFDRLMEFKPFRQSMI
jgi:hypothetical protein